MLENLKESLSKLNIQIADHYGYDAQSNLLIEECAELIQAINKYRRAKGSGQSTPVKVQAAYNNIIEELTDVEVMIEQVKHLLGIKEEDILSVREYKCNRTLQRMEKERG